MTGVNVVMKVST